MSHSHPIAEVISLSLHPVVSTSLGRQVVPTSLRMNRQRDDETLSLSHTSVARDLVSESLGMYRQRDDETLSLS